MSITNFLSLLGGLALFLYGMQMMSNGLEAAAGDRMKEILEKLTSNRILGVLVGAGITAVIQSSSATTVMVVGFVNAGMMNLQQAVWIIMGANIGTTITGQLIALDIGAIAPLIAFIGVAMVVFVKKPMAHHVGTIFAGLGVLFIGMEMMSNAMLPLREEPAFIELMTSFSNPLLGILAGALFTAIIQSSSASVGILQALARSGLIGLDGAVYVLFGQNIGTCITAVLASIGTGREAKQTTVIHLIVQPDRYSDLHDRLRPDRAYRILTDRSGRFLDTGKPGRTDCQHAYNVQRRHHIDLAAVWYLSGRLRTESAAV